MGFFKAIGIFPILVPLFVAALIRFLKATKEVAPVFLSTTDSCLF